MKDFTGGAVTTMLRSQCRETRCDPWSGGTVVKNPPANVGDPGSIPGSGRSRGEGNGNPLQYSCLENFMDKEPGGLQPMGSQRVGHS